VTGEFTLRNFEHAFVNYFLLVAPEDLRLPEEQMLLLKAIRAHRSSLERRGWESPFRWSWFWHPVLAFRQWRTRTKPPPRDVDVAAMWAQMPNVARADAELERLARHGLAREQKRKALKVYGWNATRGLA
jgi:hypothetical protein